MSISRCVATSSVNHKTVQNAEKNVSGSPENFSFVMNIFRGQVEPRQIFPYPNVLNDEQKELLQMLIDPTTKFFEVCIL